MRLLGLRASQVHTLQPFLAGDADVILRPEHLADLPLMYRVSIAATGSDQDRDRLRTAN